MRSSNKKYFFFPKERSFFKINVVIDLKGQMLLVAWKYCLWFHSFNFSLQILQYLHYEIFRVMYLNDPHFDLEFVINKTAYSINQHL